MVGLDIQPSEARRLVVYSPAFLGKTHHWRAFQERLQSEPASGTTIFMIANGHIGPTTRDSLGEHARRLRVQINSAFEAASLRETPFSEVVLVGESIGGLLVRSAWLHGHDLSDKWAMAVSRIILLAGLSRGFVTKFESDKKRKHWLRLKVLASLGRAVPGKYSWEDAMAGSDFVTDTRLRWIEKGRHGSAPMVVQFLDDRDSVVHRQDSFDSDQFALSRLEELPGIAHNEILDFNKDSNGDRYLVLSRAVLGNDPPVAAGPESPLDDKKIVFIVHGIRAGAFGWVTKLQRSFENEDDSWLVVAPTYHFFSALQFALPMTRRRKARWFADTYSDMRANYPSATMHYVGHSNGTYLLGRCLRSIEAMRFDRVYLAGSVLPADYDWDKRFALHQVQTVQNDYGRSDWIVGVLSNGLHQGLRMKDIGAGGFVGFDALRKHPNKARQHRHPGGHSAALASARLPRILEFVTSDDHPNNLESNAEPSRLWSILSRISPVLVVVLAALVVASPIALLAAPSLGSLIATCIAALLLVLAALL